MSDSFVVELPRDLRTFVRAEAKRRGFRSAKAYVEALLYAAADVPDDEDLATALIAGLASPRRISATRAYWSGKRRTLRSRHGSSGSA